MKQTISLLFVASASTVVVTAALGLSPAAAQAPGTHPAATAPVPAYPPAQPVGSASGSAAANPAKTTAYPPAQPLGRSTPTPVPSPAPAPAGASNAPGGGGFAKTAPAPAPVHGNGAPPSVAPASPTGTAAAPAGPAKMAAAPASAAPALPAPPEELASFFKGAEGTWRCDGKMPAGALGPDSKETAYKSTVKLKRDLGGFWVAGEYEIKKSKVTPGAQARFFIGYEPKSKQFVSAAFDSLGGMDRGGSSGVQGNSLSLTGVGTMNGAKVQTRSTLTFTTPGKELDYKFELDRGQGFQLVGEDTCKKGAGPLAPTTPGAPAAGAGAAAPEGGKPAMTRDPVRVPPAEAPKAK